MQNPFTTLYVTERMEDSQFPSLFSPVLVPQILPLFQAGNVVVKGTQGTGKTMLLSLLRTDIRLAFESDPHSRYPVPINGYADADLCRFVSAGINLATNQALRFANRWSKSSDSDALTYLRLCFADYVNTWILRDLLQSINTMQTKGRIIWDKNELGDANLSLDDSAKNLGNDPVVGALLRSPKTYLHAIEQLECRIETYLRYLNGRMRELPSDIQDSQSGSIGKPLSAAVQVLRENGCLADRTRVLVTIDQFEQLLDFEAKLKDRQFSLLREAVDEAIHLREPTICYRLGTRPHAWRNPRSERMRDYVELDLDDLLSKKEHSKKPLFPMFAKDVFKRRLLSFGFSGAISSKDPMISVFGKSPSPEERVSRMAGKSVFKKRLKMPEDWSSKVRVTLEGLVSESPLSAKLGMAWTYQHYAAIKAGRTPSGPLPEPGLYPWDSEEKKWWKKERIEISILQLAAACAQRIPTYGKRDIINLSGSNILVFGSICQHIWSSWNRSIGESSDIGELVFPIDPTIQDEGIRNASRDWHKKMSEEAWIGDSLLRFVDELGNYLHRELVSDKAMSYPGGNGISLRDKELSVDSEVSQILSDATDRGFLLERRHTPKNRSRGSSTKWYLHPILSPHYELTVGHTKEPRYIRAKNVRKWMVDGGVIPQQSAKSSTSKKSKQKRFPGFESEDDK